HAYFWLLRHVFHRSSTGSPQPVCVCQRTCRPACCRACLAILVATCRASSLVSSLAVADSAGDIRHRGWPLSSLRPVLLAKDRLFSRASIIERAVVTASWRVPKTVLSSGN